MIDFSTRLKCPACGDTKFSSIWSGKFSDPGVKSMLDRFFYSTDLEESLGDLVFSLVSCNGCEFRFHSRSSQTNGFRLSTANGFHGNKSMHSKPHTSRGLSTHSMKDCQDFGSLCVFIDLPRPAGSIRMGYNCSTSDVETEN